MPLDTVIVLTGVVAVFGAFAGILIYGDATWSRRPQPIQRLKR